VFRVLDLMTCTSGTLVRVIQVAYIGGEHCLLLVEHGYLQFCGSSYCLGL
jgi:hypothetical protein